MLLAAPRSFCAGVDRAIEIVERALERFGAPVYVRRQIVHNTHVVRDLEARDLIERRTAKADLRRGEVSISSKGLKLIEAVAPTSEASAWARPLSTSARLIRAPSAAARRATPPATLPAPWMAM